MLFKCSGRYHWIFDSRKSDYILLFSDRAAKYLKKSSDTGFIVKRTIKETIYPIKGR